MTMTNILDRGANIPPSTLQNRLRDAREWRGLEQVDVAKELGVGRSTISNYERGVTVPSKLVVNAWAVVCKVEVDWLKSGDETTAPDDGTPSEDTGKITFVLFANGNVTRANFRRQKMAA